LSDHLLADVVLEARVLVKVSMEEKGDPMKLPTPKLVCIVLSLVVASRGISTIKELLEKRVSEIWFVR